MLRYSSRRHKRLMDVSEYALQDAAEASRPRESRIATDVLNDTLKYREWESRHAELLVPVAEQSRKKPQIVALRQAEASLVHRRAFFRYLRENEIRGKKRERLFRLFHSTLDYNDAVLAEHKQYMLAVSSRISTDHIIDVMEDSHSLQLLRQYERAFARFFEMKCYLACAGNTDTARFVLQSMRDMQGRLLGIRRRMQTEAPTGDAGNFDRQELLSRSGRYPVLNYLNA